MAMTRNSEIRGLVAGLFEDDFPFAQSVWAEGFLGLLVELRQVFGNDMDKVMILAAIGQRMLRDPQLGRLSHSEAKSARFPRWEGHSTNIDALARATGIPRESVRRKVNELCESGLVVRQDGWRLIIRAGTSDRLQRTTQTAIAMLDQVIALFLDRLIAEGKIAVEILPPLPVP